MNSIYPRVDRFYKFSFANIGADLLFINPIFLSPVRIFDI